MDMKSIAAEALQVEHAIMKVEPTIATISGMFVPGAAPVVAMVQPAVLMAAPFVEKALSALAAGNNGDVMSAFIELLQHLTPGHANSPILSAPAPDASRLGSG